MPEVTQMKDTQTAAPTPEAAQSAPAAPAAPQASAPPVPPPARRKPAGKGRKKMIKRVIALVVILAILSGAGFGMWYLVFREEDSLGEAMVDKAQIGTIQSVVQGSGTAVPKESAAISLTQSGVVQEVYVTGGQTVMAGDPLYSIFSQAAEDALKSARDGVTDAQRAVTSAQDDLTKLQRDLAELIESRNDLTVKAPHDGKILEYENYTVGKDASPGKVCTLVNDQTLKLSLYFSYAYEDSIYVGQNVKVAVPAVMQVCDGWVEKINKVEFISTEGGTFFEVVIHLKNPGALTEGMTVTATMADGAGNEIYPYSDGKLEYSEKWDVELKVTGPVLSVNLNKYAQVKAGQVLLSVGEKDLSERIQDKQEEIRLKQEDIVARQQAVEEAVTKVEEAQKALEDFNAVAPISGQVFSCTISPGQEVKSGDTVITISNTVTMVVDIQVDSQNIGFIQAGMTMELMDEQGNPVMGTVTNVAMSGEVGTGTTTYPVQLEVDNSMGTIYNGSWMRYKLVTAESVDCVYVPNQCVKRVNDVNGEKLSVVFIQADSKPENALELDPETLGTSMPAPSEGFWPVPVTTGLSDIYNCEIIEGLEPETVVFSGRSTSEEPGMGGGMIIG